MAVKPKVKKETPEEEPVFPFIEGIGEAGGVAFTTLRHVKTHDDGTQSVIEVSVTGRGRNTIEAFENLMTAVHYAKDKGWQTRRRVGGSKPVPAGLPSAAPTKSTALPRADVAEPVGGTIHIVKLVTTPRDDGRVSLGFFAQGHKWADITKVCTIDVAIATLKSVGAFTTEHFTGIETYDPISVEVKWVNSEKLNRNGKPYKDIVEITEAK